MLYDVNWKSRLIEVRLSNRYAFYFCQSLCNIKLIFFTNKIILFIVALVNLIWECFRKVKNISANHSFSAISVQRPLISSSCDFRLLFFILKSSFSTIRASFFSDSSFINSSLFDAALCGGINFFRHDKSLIFPFPFAFRSLLMPRMLNYELSPPFQSRQDAIKLSRQQSCLTGSSLQIVKIFRCVHNSLARFRLLGGFVSQNVPAELTENSP